MLYVDEDEGLKEAGQEFQGGEEAGLVQEHAEEARNTPTSSPFQPADSRFCAKFELLLSREELQFCEEKWITEEAHDHPIYRVWELLKLNSLSTEERSVREKRLQLRKRQAIEESRVRNISQAQEERLASEAQVITQVLEEHTPKKMHAPTKKGGGQRCLMECRGTFQLPLNIWKSWRKGLKSKIKGKRRKIRGSLKSPR